MKCEYVTAGGCRLYTETHGQGPPTALLHGGFGAYDYLAPVARLIEHTMTCHRYDQRGCGRSGRERPWDGETYVADLDALRRHWQHDCWILLGHSAGVELAMAYAIRYPKNVAGLVLISSYTKAVDADAGAKYRANWRARLSADKLKEYDALASTAGDAATNARHKLRGQTDMGDMSIPAPTYRADWINNEINRDLVLPWVTAEAIGGIQVPAAVIHGAADPRPADTARQLAHTLPHGRYVEIPEVGHYPWLEQPETLRSLLLSAIQEAGQARVRPNQQVHPIAGEPGSGWFASLQQEET